METRYCIEYINPQHPLRDDGSLNVRYDRVLTLEQAEHDLTLILSFGGKILDLYMGNVVDGKTGEWSPKPMIIDDDDWFSTKWLNTLEVKDVQEEPVSIWHDASEKSNEPEDVIIINPSDNTGEVLTRCINVYQGRIWAYTSVLLNLDNPCKIGKNLQEPISKELEEASKEWLRPQLDKSYVNYGEVKMMELTHFDGYAMLDAIEFGAKWQKEQDKETIELAEDHAMLAGMMKMKEEMMSKTIDA